MSFRTNIEKVTLNNNNYRKVLYTIKNSMQLVVMSLLPKEEIGSEIHSNISQFIRVESGKGVAKIGKKTYLLRDGVAIIIPKGVKHNIINTSKVDKLKLYTIYTPPEHEPHTIQKFKVD